MKFATKIALLSILFGQIYAAERTPVDVSVPDTRIETRYSPQDWSAILDQPTTLPRLPHFSQEQVESFEKSLPILHEMCEGSKLKKDHLAITRFCWNEYLTRAKIGLGRRLLSKKSSPPSANDQANDDYFEQKYRLAVEIKRLALDEITFERNENAKGISLNEQVIWKKAKEAARRSINAIHSYLVELDKYIVALQNGAKDLTKPTLQMDYITRAFEMSDKNTVTKNIQISEVKCGQFSEEVVDAIEMTVLGVSPETTASPALKPTVDAPSVTKHSPVIDIRGPHDIGTCTWPYSNGPRLSKLPSPPTISNEDIDVLMKFKDELKRNCDNTKAKGGLENLKACNDLIIAESLVNIGIDQKNQNDLGYMIDHLKGSAPLSDLYFELYRAAAEIGRLYMEAIQFRDEFEDKGRSEEERALSKIRFNHTMRNIEDLNHYRDLLRKHFPEAEKGSIDKPKLEIQWLKTANLRVDGKIKPVEIEKEWKFGNDDEFAANNLLTRARLFAAKPKDTPESKPAMTPTSSKAASTKVTMTPTPSKAASTKVTMTPTPRTASTKVAMTPTPRTASTNVAMTPTPRAASTKVTMTRTPSAVVTPSKDVTTAKAVDHKIPAEKVSVSTPPSKPPTETAKKVAFAPEIEILGKKKASEEEKVADEKKPAELKSILKKNVEEETPISKPFDQTSTSSDEEESEETDDTGADTTDTTGSDTTGTDETAPGDTDTTTEPTTTTSESDSDGDDDIIIPIFDEVQPEVIPVVEEKDTSPTVSTIAAAKETGNGASASGDLGLASALCFGFAAVALLF